MITSKIREFIGVACVTLMGDNDLVLPVMVPELSPMTTGTVEEGDEPSERKLTLTNSAPKGVGTANLKVSNTIECTYLGNGHNGSPPNIHIGEHVMVFNFGNTSEFFWAPLGRDYQQRRTEHLKLRVANKPKNTDELTDDTSYFIEMDTREGQRKIHIHTSAGTEEEVTYDVKIDTDASTMEIVDSVGNGWKLDSNERHIRTWNETGSYLDMNKKDIHHHAVENYTVTCINYLLQAEDTITTETKVTKHTSSESIENNTKATTNNSSDTIDNNTAKETNTVTDKVITTTKENELTATIKDTTTTADQEITATGKVSITTPFVGISGSLGVGGFVGGGTGGLPAAAPTENKMAQKLTIENELKTTGKIETDDKIVAGADIEALSGDIHGATLTSDGVVTGTGQSWPDAT